MGGHGLGQKNFQQFGQGFEHGHGQSQDFENGFGIRHWFGRIGPYEIKTLDSDTSEPQTSVMASDLDTPVRRTLFVIAANI